jgi:hypothetical protein
MLNNKKGALSAAFLLFATNFIFRLGQKQNPE